MKHLVFVYGLLKGRGSIVDCRYELNASMYNLGLYPAITELGTNRIAVGQIIVVDECALKEFDIIEGVPELYKRESFESEYGKVWVYIYQGKIEIKRPISEFNQ